MGMYCCCGVKRRDNWKCRCDWENWFACFENKEIPISVPIKEIPENDGVYEVRIFDQGDYSEKTSEFSEIKKNWGQYTNQAISHWEIEYQDGYMGYTGVYAWKQKEAAEKE